MEEKLKIQRGFIFYSYFCMEVPEYCPIIDEEIMTNSVISDAVVACICLIAIGAFFLYAFCEVTNMIRGKKIQVVEEDLAVKLSDSEAEQKEEKKKFIDRSPLAQRMWKYEHAHGTKSVFDVNDVIIVRIDGSCFIKSLTTDVDSSDFLECMRGTAGALAERFGVTLAYTYSNEIYLVFVAKNERNKSGKLRHLYDGFAEKYVSAISGYSALVFNVLAKRSGCIRETANVVFDVKVFSVPSKSEAANYIFYRSCSVWSKLVAYKLAIKKGFNRSFISVKEYDIWQYMNAKGIKKEDFTDRAYIYGIAFKRTTNTVFLDTADGDSRQKVSKMYLAHAINMRDFRHEKKIQLVCNYETPIWMDTYLLD